MSLVLLRKAYFSYPRYQRITYRPNNQTFKSELFLASISIITIWMDSGYGRCLRFIIVFIFIRIIR